MPNPYSATPLTEIPAWVAISLHSSSIFSDRSLEAGQKKRACLARCSRKCADRSCRADSTIRSLAHYSADSIQPFFRNVLPQFREHFFHRRPLVSVGFGNSLFVFSARNCCWLNQQSNTFSPPLPSARLNCPAATKFPLQQMNRSSELSMNIHGTPLNERSRFTQHGFFTQSPSGYLSSTWVLAAFPLYRSKI